MQACRGCGRFAFAASKLCFWCRRAKLVAAHEKAAAYDRAFKGLVKLRRRLGFPAWKTWGDVDLGMEIRGAEEGLTWRAFLEGKAKGCTQLIRSHTYIINEVWGQVPWENAHLVPQAAHDKHGDPVSADKTQFAPLCVHGNPKDARCAQCDQDTVDAGGEVWVQPKKKLVRKKKVIRKKKTIRRKS